MAIEPPPRPFASLTLAIVTAKPEKLVRVSRYSSGEPYFENKDANRFDDPRHPVNARFGTCYLGHDIAIAIAETVLHDEVADANRFSVALDELTSRYVVEFDGAPLNLADCTGAPLKRMGLDGSFSTETPYQMTQRWAVAFHGHPANVDGFRYISRHLNTGLAVVLFDRAAAKLHAARYHPLDVPRRSHRHGCAWHRLDLMAARPVRAARPVAAHRIVAFIAALK